VDTLSIARTPPQAPQKAAKEPAYPDLKSDDTLFFFHTFLWWIDSNDEELTLANNKTTCAESLGIFAPVWTALLTTHWAPVGIQSRDPPVFLLNVSGSKPDWSGPAGMNRDDEFNDNVFRKIRTQDHILDCDLFESLGIQDSDSPLGRKALQRVSPPA
jgi:hypothetical protein